MNPVHIKAFQEGDKIQGFYLCTEKHLRTSRAGEPYLDLTLRDRTGQIQAKVWDKVQELTARFESGDPVAVRGRVESFQDHLQLIVKKINRASIQTYGRYGYSPDLIVPISEKDPKEMWQEVLRLIRTIENGFLRNLVKNIFQENKSRLLVYPASMTLHHAFRSGFLEHTLSIMKLGTVVADLYAVDRSLLLAGLALHDIGKLKELTPRLVTEYTDEGQLIGHIILGRDMVRKAARKIRGFPEELRLKLEHIILAHQGRPEWQSPRVPKFPEAFLVHMLDNLDAKLNIMQTVIRNDSETGNWTTRHNYFRISLLKDGDGSE
ncbi:MAG: HD domain-containing protein [FCB group bacterium]|nr:HD domain-containing protein [FCB group bacterium]